MPEAVWTAWIGPWNGTGSPSLGRRIAEFVPSSETASVRLREPLTTRYAQSWPSLARAAIEDRLPPPEGDAPQPLIEKVAQR
ncbi:hypothetical protein MZTS_23480 [Methylorubrum zatmanii]|nr:hypothetical protein [Methylorubrum zatmanii]